MPSRQDPVHQSRCDVEATLSVIGGKWKLMLVWFLRDGPRRFSECRRRFPEISQKVLTQQLRELEGDGVVHREVYREVPPRVDYSLTPFGRSLEPVVAALDAWGRFHGEYLLQLRRDRARAA
ncbi:MAG: Transcriptional regulator, HxlR family [uncultured Sphingomonadaceae bacterium]|uniref:Transcriptional regulator, HxlR family n=1 Tax=uncultured Sphingomonadaceae bacterium TaxID=169976 RepID=A0A6J4TP69_9SPHN|nr:MAG: Transcriptional regulator, HxlR family [uncultured Sphingomonadaceae bacterium]